MRVHLEFENTDADGSITKSEVTAIMELRDKNYILTYVEDLSGDGNLTKSSLILSEDSMRIIRKGELTTDFMYGKNIVHNASYQTPYGTLPVTVMTERYSFQAVGTEENDAVGEKLRLRAHAAYRLTIGEEEPLRFNMKITVRPYKR